MIWVERSEDLLGAKLAQGCLKIGCTLVLTLCTPFQDMLLCSHPNLLL